MLVCLLGQLHIGRKGGGEMRGSKAKKIRKLVYGDFSFHARRRYVITSKGTLMNHPDGRRAKYLQYKRLANMGVRV